MAGGSNFATWQKVAVIFIVIFGVIIAFSYFQSSHLDDQNMTYIPAEEESGISPSAPTIEPATSASFAPSGIISEQRIQDVSAPAPVAPVAKVSPTVPSKPAVTTEKSVTKGTYKIQVASFKELGKANSLQGKLKDSGYQAMVIERNLGEKGTWHQVQVGPFSTKSDAETKLAELKANYKESFIKRQ